MEKSCTVFIPLAAQGAYQSHFRWALIKTLVSRFFSLKLVIFLEKKMENNPEVMIHKMVRQRGNMTHVFCETFKPRFAAILIQKKLF